MSFAFPEPTISGMTGQVAVLHYVCQKLRIVVPAILRFDVSDNNPIASPDPYMIQRCLDGQSLYGLMEQLRSSDRRALAIQMASLCSQLCGMTFPSGGVIRAKGYSEGLGIRLTGPLKSMTRQDNASLHPLTDTLSFLKYCFDEQISERYPDGPSYPRVCRLKVAAEVASARQPFANRFSFLHRDLEPRNILVKRNGLEELVITALLDLDDAVAAPIEMAWTLPSWLWSWNDDDSDDDNDDVVDPDADPSDEDSLDVKRIFEAEIERLVPGYMSVWRGGRAVRELFHFAIHGLCNADRPRLDRLLESLGVP